jgi:23S rRNA maturation mini-RNase III
MKKLESCLIMVRAYYGKNSKMYESYIKAHPATQANEMMPQLEKTNTNILLSKIQAGMISQCDSIITSEQIKELSKFKQTPEKFDNNKSGYTELVQIDLHQYDMAGM